MDWADERAEKMFPCNCYLTGMIGISHTVDCRSSYRSIVAQALRDAVKESFDRLVRSDRLERELASAMSKLKSIWNVSPGQYSESPTTDYTFDCEQCNEMIRIAETAIDCEVGDKLLKVEDAARSVALDAADGDLTSTSKKVIVSAWMIEKLTDALKEYDVARGK